MTDADRQRLAAILGMLGSEHTGERAAAALQAEAFRKKHGLTWEALVSGKTIYRDREVVVEKPFPVWNNREVVIEKVVYVDRIIYRWPLLWRLEFIAGGRVDRSIAIALGAIPLIMVLASFAPKIRQAFGY